MSFGDDWNSFVQHPAVPASAGSLLSLRWAPGDSWKEKALSFGCGMGVACWVIPLLIEYFHLESKWAPGACYFVGGLVGMNLIAKFMQFMKETDWLGIVDFFRKGKP